MAKSELDERGISIDNKELLDEYGLTSLTLEKSGDHVKLSKIVAAKQGNGSGTRFMEDLARMADANGWTLALTPDTAFGGTSVSRLKEFYKRFGFKDNKGRSTDFETRESMVRRPEVQPRYSLPEKERMEKDIERKAKEGKYLGKAPNGKASNLITRRQWLQVRTNNFKDWFGDWELSALHDMAQKAISGNADSGTYRFTPDVKLKSELGKLTGHPINSVMIETSRIVHIDKKHGKNENLRGQIDMTAEDIALMPYYMNNFDMIVPDPKYDSKKGKSFTIYKRINGIVVVGTIEVGNTGIAVATGFKKKTADAQMLKEAPELNALDDSARAKVQKEIGNIKKTIEDSSKIVDENGEPLVVYHDTNSTIYVNRETGQN